MADSLFVSHQSHAHPTQVKYEREEPWGVFRDLSSDRKYFVWVVQVPSKNRESEEDGGERERVFAPFP